MPPKNTSNRPKQSRRHRGGVRHVWSLPSHTLLSVDLKGDVRVWDTRTGEFLRQVHTPSPVLFGTVIGETLCFVTESAQLGLLDLHGQHPLRISDLPDDVDASLVQRIERLGDAHLALFAGYSDDEEQVHIMGPYEGLQRVVPASRAERGVPMVEHAVVGEAVVFVKRLPTLVQPLRRTKARRFTATPEIRRRMGRLKSRFCIAGDRVITFENDVDDHVDASRGGDQLIWAWDVPTAACLGRVDVLDEVEGGGYLFEEEGDLADPVLYGAFGFPSGRVLSWGPEHMHLWSAKDLLMQLLMPAHAPQGALLIGKGRLLTWDHHTGALFAWSLGGSGDRVRRSQRQPLQINAHAGRVAGVAHVSATQIVSWSLSDPVVRIWDCAMGKFVRGVGG